MKNVVLFLFIDLIAWVHFVPTVYADTPPAYTPSGNLYYYHQDNLGSNSVMTDEQGNIVSTAKYQPYGDERSRTGTKLGERTYTDQIKDDSSNLMYFNARYYNPTLGIFTQPDQAGGIAKYAYASGNPISNSDPTGNDVDSGGGGGCASHDDPGCTLDQPPPPPPPPSSCAGEGMNNNPCQPNRTYHDPIGQENGGSYNGTPSELFTKSDERFRVELNGEVNNPNPDFSFGGPYGTGNLDRWFAGFQNEIYWGMYSDDDYTRSLYYDRATKWLKFINADVSNMAPDERERPEKVLGTTSVDDNGHISIRIGANSDETRRLGTLYHEGIHAFKSAKDSVLFNGQPVYTTNRSKIPGYRWDQENTAYGLEHKLWQNVYDHSQSPYILNKPDSRTMNTIIDSEFNSAMGIIMSSLFLDLSAPPSYGPGHRGY